MGFQSFDPETGSISTITTVSQLAAAMKAIIQDWTKEQKVALLCAYPDLCKIVEVLKELTKESHKEQHKAAGLQSMEGDELEEFILLMSSYREKFNFPFILAVRDTQQNTPNKIHRIECPRGKTTKSPRKGVF
jgi:2-oxo-4-hydroxy-4-carboxy-5-ureidoimidazoline decarboxylase